MDRAPETFGKYQLALRLAVGGMAEVFLATVHGEAGFAKPVVIKRLHPRYSEDPGFVQMFIDEARLTARLLHGNICQVLDLGSVEGAYYMAMEYVAGEDVRMVQDHARRRGVELPLAAAVHITSEVLAGLDYAHRQVDSDGKPLGIIHRDISPQNILISYEGEVKVIDFGIAKARNRAVQTEAGVIKGKFRYMSPEQASGRPIDHRTDLFAAAVVLYELLIGKPHSMDLPDTEVLHRMRTATFEPPSRIQPGIPAAFDKLLGRALHRKPERRFESAAAFRAELQDLMLRHKMRYDSTLLAMVMRQVFDEERRSRHLNSRAASDDSTRSISRSSEARVPRSRPAIEADSMEAAATRAYQVEVLDSDDLLTDEPTPRPVRPAPASAPSTVKGEIEVKPRPVRSGRRRGGAFSRAASDPDPAGPKPLLVARSILRPVGRPVPAHPFAAFSGPASERTADVRPRTRSSSVGTWIGLLLVLLVGGGAVAYVHRFQPQLLGLAPSPDRGAPAVPDAAPAHENRRPQALKAAPAPARGKGMMRLESTPPGASVTLCGQPTGKVTPVQLRLPATNAPCDIVLRLPGHEPYSLPASSAGGQNITIVATLRRRSTAFAPSREPTPGPAPPTGKRGTLRITSIQPATVFINGRAMGRTPRIDLALKPGTYEVTLEFDNQQLQATPRRVEVEAGRTRSLHIEAAP